MDHEAPGAGRLPPFPNEWDSDAERGAGLLDRYIAAEAESRGISREAITSEFAEWVRSKLLSAETDSACNAPVQIALHKAAKGDFETAGRFIREHIESGARSIVKDNQLERQERAIQEMEPDANLGQARRKQQSTFARAHGEQLQAEREPEWERWRAKAAEILAGRKRKASKRELARLVKEALSLPDSIETIRKTL